MERRPAYGQTLPTTTSPDVSSRERKVRRTANRNTCSIASVFYLLLGFQLAWIFIGLTQKGGSWQEIQEIEKRLGERIESVSRVQDQRVQQAKLRALENVSDHEADLVWNLLDEPKRQHTTKAPLEKPQNSVSKDSFDTLDPSNIGTIHLKKRGKTYPLF